MIEQYSFGTMTVDGKTYARDLKIIRGMVVADWWRKEGHLVALDDVPDILAADPDIVIIGTGAQGAMRVAASLRQALENRNIELIAESSDCAARSFNGLLISGRNVAAAFHLTC